MSRVGPCLHQAHENAGAISTFEKKSFEENQHPFSGLKQTHFLASRKNEWIRCDTCQNVSFTKLVVSCVDAYVSRSNTVLDERRRSERARPWAGVPWSTLPTARGDAAVHDDDDDCMAARASSICVH